MRRVTIYLPDELYEQLRLDAVRDGISLTELIRTKLKSSAAPPRRSESQPDPILKVAGICRGPVFSSAIDEGLYGD